MYNVEDTTLKEVSTLTYSTESDIFISAISIALSVANLRFNSLVEVQPDFCDEPNPLPLLTCPTYLPTMSNQPYNHKPVLTIFMDWGQPNESKAYPPIPKTKLPKASHKTKRKACHAYGTGRNM